MQEIPHTKHKATRTSPWQNDRKWLYTSIERQKIDTKTYYIIFITLSIILAGIKLRGSILMSFLFRHKSTYLNIKCMSVFVSEVKSVISYFVLSTVIYLLSAISVVVEWLCPKEWPMCHSFSPFWSILHRIRIRVISLCRKMTHGSFLG